MKSKRLPCSCICEAVDDARINIKCQRMGEHNIHRYEGKTRNGFLKIKIEWSLNNDETKGEI